MQLCRKECTIKSKSISIFFFCRDTYCNLSKIRMNLSGFSKRGMGIFWSYDISLENTPTSHTCLTHPPHTPASHTHTHTPTSHPPHTPASHTHLTRSLSSLIYTRMQWFCNASFCHAFAYAICNSSLPSLVSQSSCTVLLLWCFLINITTWHNHMYCMYCGISGHTFERKAPFQQLHS